MRYACSTRSVEAYANAAARRFWGLGEDEYVGRSLAELGRRASLATALDRQLQRALETATAGRDGERRGALLANGSESGVAFGFAPVEAGGSPARLMLAWLAGGWVDGRRAHSLRGLTEP